MIRRAKGTMSKRLLTAKDETQIDDAVAHFVENRQKFDTFAKSLIMNLSENPQLASYIQFIKYRVKDPIHLQRKLAEKACAAKLHGKKLDVTAKNLFSKVTDLAGVRILHLHTEQLEEMNRIILMILEKHKYRVLEGPTANCWDIEYEEIFKTFGIDAQTRDSMYTS